MIIDITGRHVSVTEDLKEHAQERLAHVLRHFGEVISAHIILDVEKGRSMAEMVVHGRQITAAVHADGGDLHAAVDRAADKMRVQLERHHDRNLAKRRKAGKRVPEIEARAAAEISAVLAARKEVARKPEPPKVVRTKPKKLPAMTIDEAAVELQDGDQGFMVFRDSESEQVGVLYRRPDGSLALVETGSR